MLVPQSVPQNPTDLGSNPNSYYLTAANLRQMTFTSLSLGFFNSKIRIKLPGFPKTGEDLMNDQYTLLPLPKSGNGVTLELPITNKEMIFHLSHYFQLQWSLRPTRTMTTPQTTLAYVSSSQTMSDQQKCFSAFLVGEEEALSLGVPPVHHTTKAPRSQRGDSVPQSGGCRPECGQSRALHTLPLPVAPSQPLLPCWYPPSSPCQQRP